MNSKEIYQLEATAKQVHNELADALVSLNFMRANFEVFPRAHRHHGSGMVTYPSVGH